MMFAPNAFALMGLLLTAVWCNGAIMRRSADSSDDVRSGLPNLAEKLPRTLAAINSITGGAQLLPGPKIPSIVKKAGTEDDGEARLPLPGPLPIDIEQIKRIAALLSYIGNQILPAILDPSGAQQNAVETN